MEATSKTFAYARVSTPDQNTARQLDALDEHTQDERDLFIDKQSGKDFNRLEYLRMKAGLRSGDTVVITSIDRLGRNYAEILNEWRDITKQRKCNIVELDIPLLDTRSKSGNDLTGTLIADIVLQLLAYVAETERGNIHKRQMEGIAAAMRRGQHMGRPRIGYPQEFAAVYKSPASEPYL
jgi:DNA invertase Pin-like site-specific DNA recombinase